jgi:ABC-2 type transport system ATP-binding protein
LIQALRRHPHAHSVFPFGDELHYTDAREDAAADEVARDVAAYLAREGFADVRVEPAAAGIEDSFMALMGAPKEAAA